MTTATLTGLKLTAAQKPTHMSPVQLRRNKLAKRLWEQAELALAQAAGTTFSPTRYRTITDKHTGTRQSIQTNKRIKQWWFVADTGKLCLSVRYGTKLLELAKGKYAVEIAAEKDLVGTIDVVRAAVLAGEMDAALDAASVKLRAGFGK